MDRPGPWRVSPALPAAANAALALLWLLSAYGGWGEAAFCSSDGSLADPACLEGFHTAVSYSLVVAVPALVLAFAGALLLNDDPDALDVLLTATAALWIIAEAVVFTGGYLSQPLPARPRGWRARRSARGRRGSHQRGLRPTP
ncbi:hypothetical protein [Actinocorallia sp. A-T 12471]|uniref:hypothetical protein n=1 Tax=Actinocorallia sp. A-T 12471 TaxID=3089813 RepID=UPI0029CD4D30|nr:hypothetical protein [Actinocorallia sp. A-T 12471]MDX6744962.1 hypothetical protein [Actinocorallia sp. A-T 12471]